MGQAKRRGTLEQRIEQARARDVTKAEAVIKRIAHGSEPREPHRVAVIGSRSSPLIMAALAAALCIPHHPIAMVMREPDDQ